MFLKKNLVRIILKGDLIVRIVIGRFKGRASESVLDTARVVLAVV